MTLTRSLSRAASRGTGPKSASTAGPVLFRPLHRKNDLLIEVTKLAICALEAIPISRKSYRAQDIVQSDERHWSNIRSSPGISRRFRPSGIVGSGEGAAEESPPAGRVTD